MKISARIAVVMLALSPLAIPLAAWGDASPRVVLATPGIGGGAIERFTLRFSEPMVPLGDPAATAPAAADCPVTSTGRWVDQQTFVIEFATGLPGGITCSVKLRDKLRSLSGYAVTGRSEFAIDSGGPVARGVLPSAYGSEIEEDQIFLVAANTTPDPVSVAANAYCAVDGIGEKIAVDIVPRDQMVKLVGDLGNTDWNVRNFLETAGLPAELPASAADRVKALESVTALKCRRPLPAGRDMALVWGAGIRSAGGKTAGTDQRYDFSVRKPFTARFECSRVNPQAGCSPVQEAWVRFSGQVPRALAEAVRIETADGKSIAPVLTDDQKRAATLSDLKFASPLPEATTAKLILPAGIRDESGRPLVNAERFPLDIRFDMAPPLIKFAAGFGILEAKEGGVLPMTVRAVEPQLAGRNLTAGGRTLRIDASDGEIAKWLRTIDDADDYDVEEVTRGKETIRINNTGSRAILPAGKGSGFTVTLPGQGKAFEVVGIPLKATGFYVVEVASPALGRALLGRDAPRYVATGALVTNMSVHFKWGRDSSLAWVTTLDGAKPVGGADVRITDSCTGAMLARGTSDSEGRLLVRKGLPAPETWGSCDVGSTAHPLMVSARADGDFSFTLTQWSEGIKPYDFDLPYGWSESGDTLHTVFDRALLRQGETINMKHILRKPVATGFALAPGFKGTLKLSHRGSDTQFEMPLVIDANGIGETSWTAPAGTPMGDYDLQIVIPTVTDGKPDTRTIYSEQSFKVDEYKLPTMKATVAGPKDAAIRPGTLPIDLFVGYLSGGGAPNLPVELRIGWFERAVKFAGYEGFTFGGRKVSEGTKAIGGDTEEDAAVTLPPTQTLPTTLSGDGTARTTVEVPQNLDAATTMLVEMDYQDANGQILTATRGIPIYTSAVQLGIRTDGWLMKDDDLRLKFVALDTGGKPMAGQRVAITLYSREVLTARRRLIGGFYAYDNQLKTTKLATSCAVTTDRLGLAECKLDPGVSGEVYAVATTTDANGNEARATTSVWLAGEDEWWFGGDNGDRMDVIPEQVEYKAGEKAKFQVRMPFRSATALVTVEREGVLSSFVTELSGSDPVVEVEMPGAYAPDVFVSVLAVRGRVGGWRAWLSNLARDWDLPFFSRDSAKPTALVDLAKPAYRIGMAKVKVGWDSHRLNVAVKADKDRYAARDTAQVALEVKTPDGKPAATADVAFVAVDEALLQLAPNESWDVLTAMMGDRPLSVLTSTAQTQVVGKRHYGRKAVEAGGGGGGDLSGLNRENFQPVLLWKGRVALDAQGKAVVPVPLSDALSAFRMVAIATDGSSLFGTGEASVRTAQDLSIFAGVPPLARTGDTFGAVFTLRNGSTKPMTVDATVAVAPQIATGKPIRVTIPAGGAVPVAWNLTMPQRTGTLTWQVTARATDGKAVDRVTVAQTIAPAVPVEVWAATIARVGSGTSIAIQPPKGALADMGNVDIRLSDTLAPPLQGVRDYMSAYPYNCFEQRLSRAIALGDMAAWNRLAAETPAFLDGNGLLRYFMVDTMPGSEALTAYVLSITAEAGLAIPEAPRARMIEAMKAVLDGRLRQENYGDVRLQRVAAFAALARQGAATPAMLGQLGITPAEMPTAVLGDYLMALDRVQGLANVGQLRAAAEAQLRTRLVYEGTRVDLSDKATSPWWLMSSADEGAIKALIATLGRPGWQDEGAKLMIGVAQRQSRGHWDTTPANAWGTLAVRKFAGIYPAQAIAGTTTASLGSTTLTRGWPMTPAAMAQPIRFGLPAQATPLNLSQSGGAGPWALVQVRAAVPLLVPRFDGYRMTRTVEMVQARTKGVLTRGDVVKVTITVDASAERNWVVISDPIPAGATVLGSQGGQSQLLASEGDDETGVQPNYVERGNDAWRAFYGWMPRGQASVSYVMRLNTAGRLNLPPTRVEAMYAPEIRAMVPNAVMTVQQR